MTRDEAINELKCAIDLIKQDGKDWLDERDIPLLNMAIEALERKQGKNISEDGFLCSVCTFGDFGGFHGYEPNFCPNCGARMDERREE